MNGTQQELYACVLIQDYPLQALLRLRPDLRHQPCVVMDGKPPLQFSCALNPKARSLGAQMQMTAVEMEMFPSITTLARSLVEESTSKAVLLECSGTYSPRVECQSKEDSLLCILDITGTARLHGQPEVLAADLLARAKSLGFEASIAVSSNFYTAISIALNTASHKSITVILKGDERAALAPVSIAVLPLTEEQYKTLTTWGIHNLGMLADLPEKSLIARMGQQGKQLHQLAHGKRPHLFVPVEADFALEERIELDTPVELLDSLLFVVGIMLEQLILRAVARIFALASVTVVLSLEGGSSHTRTVQPALPSNDRQMWIKLIHLDMEANPPNAPILSLTLSAAHGTTSKVQLGLFSPQLPEPMRLDVTLARIRAIVGDQCVGRVVLEDSHKRESYRMETFKITNSNASSSESSHAKLAMRQLRPVEIIPVSLRAKRPHSFSFRESRYTVERSYGPWLASGDWWNPTLWNNEQWDLVARSDNGSILCCCLARDLVQNCWQMMALYD